MLDVRLATPWRNTYSQTFLDLLATCSLDHAIVRTLEDSFVVEVKPHYALQVRAVQLLAREFAARLWTGDMDHSHDPWCRLYGDLHAASASHGAAAAERYLREAPSRDLHADAGFLGPQLTLDQYTAELASVMADAATLAADVAASLASDIAIDEEHETDHAPGIAAAHAAARAEYAARLADKYPNRGFT